MDWVAILIVVALSAICIYQIYKLIIDIKNRKKNKVDENKSNKDIEGGEK